MFAYVKLSTFLLSAFLLIVLPAGAQSGDPGEDLVIALDQPYDATVSAIQQLGGTVTYQYKHIDAVAARVPRSALPAVRSLVGGGALSKDLVVPAPRSVDLADLKGLSGTPAHELALEALSVEGISDVAAFAEANPNAYQINNSIMNLDALHAGGFTGSGIVVAVIDSGIRPGFPHIDLDGSVVGCDDFVGDALGCSNFGNGGHGTFVAGMISANVVFAFAPTSAVRGAVERYCPSCFIGPPAFGLIPMVGSAPLSSVYALRVFGPTGGSPTSRILAAIDRVIDLRQKFDAGQPGGVKIDVCNMSLGGATLFAGRDVFDQAVDRLLENGIIPVVSAGNSGPATLTTGSPASAFSAITVGAASHAHNERILRDLQFGPFIGGFYRPFSGTQTAVFSSRGPNADGRPDPDVVASGFASFGQGFAPSPIFINIASGTSFSGPSVAGVAAVLRQAFPWATATEIRNAIIASANPAIVTDGSGPLDEGNGFVDAGAAAALLTSGGVSNTLPPVGKPNKNVKVNVEKSTDLDVRNGLVTEHFSDLKPGQRADILYRVNPNTSQVVVSLTNVTPALPPSQQNPFFGDDILLGIHTAKTSTIGDGDYPVLTFTSGGTFAVNDPETGLMRISVNGDWTNAGTISADVTIFPVTDPLPGSTTKGKIEHLQTLVVPIDIPAGASTADFRLIWREDWSNYPLSDLDMILIPPVGPIILDGASLDDPERVVINGPAAGAWLVIIDAFDVPTGSDKFELRVAVDGKVLK